MSQAHVRYLARAAIPPLAALVAGGLALWGPWSVLALDRANARWVRGDERGAFEAYVTVAEGWHAPETRAAASTRAGLLALAVGDASNGARWLRRAVDLEPDVVRRVMLRRQLADVYLERFDDPVRAADTLALAAREAMSTPAQTGSEASWLEAARAYERGGRFDACRRAYAEGYATLTDTSARAEAAAGETRCAVREAGPSAAALTVVSDESTPSARSVP